MTNEEAFGTMPLVSPFPLLNPPAPLPRKSLLRSRAAEARSRIKSATFSAIAMKGPFVFPNSIVGHPSARVTYHSVELVVRGCSRSTVYFTEHDVERADDGGYVC
jgi:hypothetical protein